MTDERRQEHLLVEAIEAEAWADMVEAVPEDLARRTGSRVEWSEAVLCLVAPSVPSALFNRALNLGCLAPATEGDVDRVLDVFRSAGAPRFWIHLNPAAGPAALESWLRSRGLAPDPELPAWAKVLRGAEPAPAVATDLRVGPLERGRASELGQVLAAAHGLPRDFGAWFAALTHRDGWSAHAALDGDRIVGGGLLFVSGTRAWLGAGGTLASHRRRGAQRAVMAARIDDARKRGCTVIATETGDRPGNPSLHNMLHCGFRRVCARLNYGPI